MRAREFITEDQGKLASSQADPLQHTYIIPGIRNNDPYHAYRLGIAMARARADLGGDGADLPEFHSISAFGQNAVVAGFNDNVEAVIDKALQLTHTPGGKKLVGTKQSQEPDWVNDQSVARPFRGYPR
jgi:hypothetical protein